MTIMGSRFLLRARGVLVADVHLGARGLRRFTAACSRCLLPFPNVNDIGRELDHGHVDGESLEHSRKITRSCRCGRGTRCTVWWIGASAARRPRGRTSSRGLGIRRAPTASAPGRGPDRPRGDARVGLRLLARRDRPSTRRRQRPASSATTASETICGVRCAPLSRRAPPGTAPSSFFKTAMPNAGARAVPLSAVVFDDDARILSRRRRVSPSSTRAVFTSRHAATRASVRGGHGRKSAGCRV